MLFICLCAWKKKKKKKKEKERKLFLVFFTEAEGISWDWSCLPPTSQLSVQSARLPG